MPEHLHTIAPRQRQLSIVILNLVSVLSQFGQYGLGTTLIPIGLKVRQATPEAIGFSSAALWLGMLLGLLLAGQFTRKLGYRHTLILGICLSSISFVLMPLLPWLWWAAPASVIGFGLGLRWIALETWLYRLVPAQARGRVVGIHETLLACAAILGPLLIVTLDTIRPDAFWIASAVMLLGLLPLIWVTTIAAHSEEQAEGNVSHFSLKFWLGLGAIIAGLGGYMEASLLALLPVYMADLNFSAQDAAWLLTVFQMGAMLFQFPVGWMADHYGLLKTTRLCGYIAFVTFLVAILFAQMLSVLTVAIFILGGVIAATLSLGIIWAIHNNTGTQITFKVRQVSIVYTSLSAAGPLITGFVISHSSSATLFWQQLLVLLILLGVLYQRRSAS
jgi:MFS family permease